MLKPSPTTTTTSKTWCHHIIHSVPNWPHLCTHVRSHTANAMHRHIYAPTSSQCGANIVHKCTSAVRHSVQMCMCSVQVWMSYNSPFLHMWECDYYNCCHAIIMWACVQSTLRTHKHTHTHHYRETAGRTDVSLPTQSRTWGRRGLVRENPWKFTKYICKHRGSKMNSTRPKLRVHLAQSFISGSHVQLFARWLAFKEQQQKNKPCA